MSRERRERRSGQSAERANLVLTGLLIFSSGCSGGEATAEPGDMPIVGDERSVQAASATDPSSQGAAAAMTAKTNPACLAIAPFYWEIGDSSGTQVSGSVGSAAPAASTVMAIASASKWLFGAYVIQKMGGEPDATYVPFLNLTSGYVGADTCPASGSIGDCAGAAGAQTAAQVGRFDYGGAHFQKLASLMGIGADDNAALATEVKSQIGPELELEYSEPDPAGGVRMSADQYALFLRKLLTGSPTPLLLGSLLGNDAVCTNPDLCGTATSSPIKGSAASPENWHYGLAHWIEDDAAVGDGGFSSPGAYGFYPWVDAARSVYGVLAREVPATGGNGYRSAVCGRSIRRAWLSNAAQ